MTPECPQQEAMLLHHGLWIGDFEVTASAIQLGEPQDSGEQESRCTAHKAGLQGALPSF